MRIATRVAYALVVVLCTTTTTFAQAPSAEDDDFDKKPFIEFRSDSGFGFDPTAIQPGSHIFFPDTLSEGEIEIFNDGKLSFDVQLIGGDVVKYVSDGKLRFGLNGGIGIGQHSDASVLLTNLSFFVQVGAYYRIDLGFIHGISGKDGLDRSQRDRDAWFVGISFPTKITEGLKKLLSTE